MNEWKLLLGRMFETQVTVQEKNILHTEALVETVSHIFKEAASKVIGEQDSHDPPTNEGWLAKEAIPTVHETVNTKDKQAKLIIGRLKDAKARAENAKSGGI